MEYIIHHNIIEKLYRNLENFIHNEYKTGKKVVIFGTSKPSQMLLQYLQNREIPVYALVDNNKTKEGNIYSNVKTYIPEKILFPYDGSMQILIVSQHQDSMVGQLEKMGYSKNNIYIILDLNQELNNFSISDNCGYKEMTRKEIQLSQIKCLDYLKEVCEKNDIDYYLACGTALGAIRHKGYIPWDDDIDVCMDIRDLKRFINIVKRENKFGIISAYSEGEYLGGDMAKLIDMDTYVHSNHFPLPLTIGISIDVFPLYGLPENEEERKKFIKDLKRLEIDYFENLLNEEKAKSCLKTMLGNMETYPFSTSTYVGHILTLGYKKEVMVFKREYFDGNEMVEFEGNYYRVPKMWHEYLADLYDDYMVLPEVSKRVAHHHYKAFRID